jgi:DnaK suppressor protein
MENEEIRARIEQEIEKTKALLEEYGENTKPVEPDVAIGRVSRMDAINNKSVTEAAMRQAKVKIENLKRVLSTVGTPEFGVCLKCKGKIPVGRLLIRPESLYCVNCSE